MEGEEGITQRMDSTGAAAGRAAEVASQSHASLRAGDVLAGRYTIIDGPLGSRTGEADVYRCEDGESGDVVAVKYYRAAVQPKEEVLKRLRGLKHDDIVQLRAMGDSQGRFYEVMEFCAGGTLADLGTVLVEGKLRPLLRKAISGLQYLHTSGIVHRDIKPTNLFFRDKQRRDLVIGDFGISSIVAEDVRIDTTTTINRMTFEYAAPEQLGDKKFGPKTDYYSLGLTFLFALHGRSPFQGMDEYKIMELKSRSELPIPSRCSEEVCRLLRGLTRRNAQFRWGYAQVQAWLEGKPVSTDEGLPDSVALDHADRSAPYPAFPKITNPVEMAANLEKFRAEYELFHGFISRWVHLHFSAELAHRIVGIEENYSKEPKLGVFKLRYLLDPRLPLEIDGERIRGLKELANFIEVALRENNRARLAVCEGLLYERNLESWMEATIAGDAGAKAAEAAAELRGRHKSPRLGLIGLLYKLNPRAPLFLGAEIAVASPSELEAVLQARPESLAGLDEAVFDGGLGEWLRLVFPDRTEDLRIVTWCAESLRNKRDLGLEVVRWRFDPSRPFVREGFAAKDPDELARLIGADEDSFRRGMRLLEQGWIRGWLVATGRLERPEVRDTFDEVVTSRASWGAKMQAVLGKLSSRAAKPVPVAQPAAVSFGSLLPSATRRIKVIVRNGGGGFLSGAITLDQQESACRLDGETRIDGSPVEFTITASPQGEPAGARRKVTIRIATNGGTLEIPVTYSVGAPWTSMLGRSAVVGLAWGAFLGLIRLIFAWAVPDFSATRMNWMGSRQVIPGSSIFSIDFELVRQCVIVSTLGCLLAAAAGAWIYYLVRLRGRRTISPAAGSAQTRRPRRERTRR
jgi:hypothetical protein